VGTISAAGLYSAPAAVSGTQTVNITAASSEDPSVRAAASVTLKAGIVVRVSPDKASLGPSESRQFVAWLAGAVNGSVRWSIQPSLGAISAQGLYTAPATLAACRL